MARASISYLYFYLCVCCHGKVAMPSPIPPLRARHQSVASYSFPSTSRIPSVGMGNGSDPNGVGVLTLQRALDVARNSEGSLDPAIATYLERELASTWARILQQPESYLMSKDELSLFNYYRARFERNPRDAAISRAAIERFWRTYHASNGA